MAKKNFTGRASFSRRTHMFRISVSPGDWERNPGSGLAADVSAGETPSVGKSLHAHSWFRGSTEHVGGHW